MLTCPNVSNRFVWYYTLLLGLDSAHSFIKSEAKELKQTNQNPTEKYNME